MAEHVIESVIPDTPDGEADIDISEHDPITDDEEENSTEIFDDTQPMNSARATKMANRVVNNIIDKLEEEDAEEWHMTLQKQLYEMSASITAFSRKVDEEAKKFT